MPLEGIWSYIIPPAGRRGSSPGTFRAAPFSREQRMFDTVHMVLPGTQELVSPYGMYEASQRIGAAESFSVTIDAVVVSEDLDGYFSGDNDLMVLTRSALGDRPRVERVHFFEEEVRKGRPLRNLFANTAHVTEDYNGTDRLWLELIVLEIDSDRGERYAAMQSFQTLAATAGAVFPALLPYAFGAAALAGLVDRLIDTLKEDAQVVRAPVSFHGGTSRPGRIPLQEGTFVVFPRPTSSEGLQLAPNGLLEENGAPAERSYMVFNVFREIEVSHDHLTNQQIATLLTQMRDGNDNSARGTLDFLRETMEAYGDLQRLERYRSLARKIDLTDAERDMLEAIREDPQLAPYVASLPVQGGPSTA